MMLMCAAWTLSSRATTRRTLLRSAAVIGGALATQALAPLGRALAGAPAILKPLPADQFVDFGTNAEMRWSSVDPRRYLTPQSRLFVRNHTVTPTIDAASYALKVYGDGLRSPRTATSPVTVTLRDLKRLPRTTLITSHECTGNGRSFFSSQQGTPASGTAWTLGAVGTVRWEGVRLRDLLRHLGLDRDAVSVQATGLDPSYVDRWGRLRPGPPPVPDQQGARRRAARVGDERRAAAARPRLPAAAGAAGLGRHRAASSGSAPSRSRRTELTSPWNTKWYRMTGRYPATPVADDQPGALGLGAPVGRRARPAAAGSS